MRSLIQMRGGHTWKAFLDQLRTNRQFTGRIAATVVQRQERRTRTGGRIGIVTLSDPTAQFEATVYQERLTEWRELLEPGHSLFLQIGGSTIRTPKKSARAFRRSSRSRRWRRGRRRRSASSLTRPEPIERLASRLDKGEGTVSVVVLLKGREVEVKLPGQYRVTPQIAGAIKAVPGIVHVEMR